MYSVGDMRRALAGLDDEQPLMVVFFRKQDAEDLLNEYLEPTKWAHAADLFHNNNYIEGEVCDIVRFCVSEAKGLKVLL